VSDLDDLARALLPDPAEPKLQLRKGQVTAIAAPTVTVTLGGSSTAIAGVSHLASYSPTVNDIVFVLVDGPSLLVLGKLA